MREIGGYIEFEEHSGKEYYNNMIALNCARNCLSYLNRIRKIKKLYIPYFLCDSVNEVCKRDGVEVEFYHIDKNLYPIFDKKLNDAEWIYIVNYYGQITNKEIKLLKNRYEQIIIDNVQAFFQQPLQGVDTIYTCRKYFGVPDGAYLSTEMKGLEEIPETFSYNRTEHLGGRFERTAGEFYKAYVENEKKFIESPISKMSKLSHNLLRGVDYEKIKRKREENFLFLHQKLNSINNLNLRIPVGPFMYPLLIDNGVELREKLQRKKIYIPMLWSDVLTVCKEADLEYNFAKNILPLPIDQRYTLDDMSYMIQVMQGEDKS